MPVTTPEEHVSAVINEIVDFTLASLAELENLTESEAARIGQDVKVLVTCRLAQYGLRGPDNAA